MRQTFLGIAGVAVPPKQLRASFCTYLRSADDIDEELLKSCAYVVLAPRTHRLLVRGAAVQEALQAIALLEPSVRLCADGVGCRLGIQVAARGLEQIPELEWLGKAGERPGHNGASSFLPAGSRSRHAPSAARFVRALDSTNHGGTALC